jgi:hypothetical protein
VWKRKLILAAGCAVIAFAFAQLLDFQAAGIVAFGVLAAVFVAVEWRKIT